MFQEDLLKNKTIIITGGGTGLGKSMATRFGELGANLVITSRKQDVLDSTANELKATGAQVLPIACDVRKTDEVQNVVDKTIGKFGKIAILVNNAAGNFISPTELLTTGGCKVV